MNPPLPPGFDQQFVGFLVVCTLRKPRFGESAFEVAVEFLAPGWLRMASNFGRWKLAASRPHSVFSPRTR